MAAETEEAAERAVDLIDVEYEELPVVADRSRQYKRPRRCFIPTWQTTKDCCTKSKSRAMFSFT